MTFLTKPSLVVKKTPLIEGKGDEEVIQMQQPDAVWTKTKRSYGTFFWTTLTTFLVTLVGITTGLMLYRHYLQATTAHRYTRFCTVPIKVKETAVYDPKNRVMPLRWTTVPEVSDLQDLAAMQATHGFDELEGVQVLSAASGDLSDEVIEALHEEFDIGDTVEKINVNHDNHRISFVHDFQFNMTGIIDVNRCFTMEMDPGVVVPPQVLVLSISRGDEFDVSRVRAALQADLLTHPAPIRPLPEEFRERCKNKPTYRLMKAENIVIRKRSVDARPHDYILFSGRHVQEIEITNLADVLQHEQEIRARRAAAIPAPAPAPLFR